jgi:ribonuclease H2 subunit C
MSMFAIHLSNNSPPQKTTPNLLPLRINHNGSLPQTGRYWKPTTSDNTSNPTAISTSASVQSTAAPAPETFTTSTKHVYFRGRHLHGTTHALPAKYTGAILNMTEKDLPSSMSTNLPSAHANSVEDEDEDEPLPETKIAEKIGEFDEVVVWGHGGVVDEGDEGVSRGLKEWIGFAEAMHVDEEDEDEESEGQDKMEA